MWFEPLAIALWPIIPADEVEFVMKMSPGFTEKLDNDVTLTFELFVDNRVTLALGDPFIVYDTSSVLSSLGSCP